MMPVLRGPPSTRPPRAPQARRTSRHEAVSRAWHGPGRRCVSGRSTTGSIDRRRCYNLGLPVKIRELFSAKKPVFSFEFFPPKTDVGMANLERTIRELSDLHPQYVSVTYGAGGSTRDRTVELVTRLQNESGICAMAHFTCAGATRDEMAAVLDRLVDGGIENIIALRGDPPAGAERFEATGDGFAHASELIAFLRARFGDRISIAAACYPEGHVECRDLERDLAHLTTKVRAGCDFLITQLFFDNEHYFRFVERARAAGIHIP